MRRALSLSAKETVFVVHEQKQIYQGVAPPKRKFLHSQKNSVRKTEKCQILFQRLKKSRERKAAVLLDSFSRERKSLDEKEERRESCEKNKAATDLPNKSILSNNLINHLPRESASVANRLKGNFPVFPVKLPKRENSGLPAKKKRVGSQKRDSPVLCSLLLLPFSLGAITAPVSSSSSSSSSSSAITHGSLLLLLACMPRYILYQLRTYATSKRASNGRW